MRSLPLSQLAILALVACHIPDGGGEDSDADTGDSSAGPPSLADIVDLSVNRAAASLDADGGLRLSTESGSNPAGGFGGPGLGNKAIAGLPDYDGMRLDALSGLAYESQLVAGTWTPYFNLVLDLDGTGSTLKVIVAAGESDTSPDDLGRDVWRYTFPTDADQWTAVGGLDDLLPSHISGETAALSAVLDNYPDAVLRDADTYDAGLPAGVVTTAVMLILGDSNNEAAAEQLVSAIEVGDTRYEAASP